MATVRVFEELEIWQMAAVQAQSVFEMIRDGRFDRDRALSDQMNRSSGSVMDNIAEGFDRFSKADFRQFLIVARGSNAEVRSQLYRAKSRSHITENEAADLIQQSRHLGIRINKLIQHLDRSSFKMKPKAAPNAVAEPFEYYQHSNEDLYYDLLQEMITSG
jgi:four helix bundle protein